MSWTRCEDRPPRESSLSGGPRGGGAEPTGGGPGAPSTRVCSRAPRRAPLSVPPPAGAANLRRSSGGSTLLTIVLGDNQYGKAETHVVRVTRSGGTHEVKDLTVTIALAGDFAQTHITGDNSKVVPTDTQKNTVFAFAREPIGEIEDFALRLARHFVSEFASVYRARVHIDEASWSHINVGGKPHDH